jgi:hypothetical protein
VRTSEFHEKEIIVFLLALKWFQEDPSPGTQELPKKFFSPGIF